MVRDSFHGRLARRDSFGLDKAAVRTWGRREYYIDIVWPCVARAGLQPLDPKKREPVKSPSRVKGTSQNSPIHALLG